MGGGMGGGRTDILLPAPGTEPKFQMVAYNYQGGLGSKMKAPPQQRSRSAAPPRAGGMGAKAGAGGRGTMAGGGAQAQAVKSDYDVTVEIWGLIYIFEEPDFTKLGIDEALAADLAADDTASETETSDDGE